MQERHIDRKRYFDEQGITTEKYVIPYVESVKKLNKTSRVLEVGCGEGGNLLPFLKRGFEVVGVDLNKNQLARAREYLAKATPECKVTLLDVNIYEVDVNELGQFDLIILRDVIEHIRDQEKFLRFVKKLLKPEGVMFFGFPPWRMPFGGHQQICNSKILSKLPFFHLLGTSLYQWLLSVFGEKKYKIDSLLEIKETGISIHRFESILKREKYIFKKKDLFFINPNYEIKFGLKPKKLLKPIASLPYVKDFFTTCYYCVVQKTVSIAQ